MDHEKRLMPPGGGLAPFSLAACASGLAVVFTLCAGTSPALALPAGKAWSAVIDTLKLPGHTYGIVPMRLEPDSLGRPLAFVEAQGGIGRDMYVLRWEDSTWRSVAHLDYGTKGVRPVPSPAGTHHLIWSGLEEIEPEIRSYLVMNEFAGDSLSRPDTVTTIYAGSLTYGAAASSVRRWAAVGDYGDLRLLYSGNAGTWIEVPVGGRGDQSVAVAALDDTTALVAWRDLFLGPGAGILRGPIWTLITPPHDGHLRRRSPPSPTTEWRPLVILGDGKRFCRHRVLLRWGLEPARERVLRLPAPRGSPRPVVCRDEPR